MNAFYKDKKEYAVSTFTFEHEGAEEALSAIAGQGFPSVELWGDTVHFDPRVEPDLLKTRRLLRDLDLSVHSLHTPFRNFPLFSNPAEGEAWRLDLWKRSLDICAELDVPIAVVHALNRVEYNYGYDRIGYVKGLLDTLARYAHARGVKLALENIPSGSAGGDEILCTLTEQTRLFGDVEHLYWCLDIGHVTLTQNNMESEIDRSMDRLVTFHIHNNDGVTDRHDTPDEGVIDWPKWHDYLRGKGYAGQFVLEIYCGDDPREQLRKLASLFAPGTR